MSSWVAFGVFKGDTSGRPVPEPEHLGRYPEQTELIGSLRTYRQQCMQCYVRVLHSQG